MCRRGGGHILGADAPRQVPRLRRDRLAPGLGGDRARRQGHGRRGRRSPTRPATSRRRTRSRSTAAPVEQPSERVVYALNKPAGVVSTARDPQGRPTVVSLVPGADARLYPVGRLDADTTGLILLTNDGELAHRLTHPRFEVEKTYRAVVANPPVRAPALRALRDGVEARRRRHRAGARAQARARRARAHDPRGPQAPGAADVRGGRPPGQAARAGRVRPARSSGDLPAQADTGG